MPQANSSLKNNALVKATIRNSGILIALIAMCIILSITSDAFMTNRNIMNVLQQISTNSMIAFAMTYVILLGGIDLSVGAVVCLSGVIAMKMMADLGVGLVPAFACAVGLGILVGVINGALVTYLKMPAFIVTLATMNITRGLAQVITSGKPIYVQDERLLIIGNGKLFGNFPMQAGYMIVTFIIMWIALNYTKFGRRLYATGGNAEAALFSGINTRRITMSAYIISGLVSGIVGVMTSARLYSALPTMGEGAEMDAIAAVVLGGTMMSGGYGTLGGTFIGALIIGVMNNGLNLLGVNSYWQNVCKGIIIILAILMDIIKNKRRAKKGE